MSVTAFVDYLRGLFNSENGNAHALIDQIEHKIGILLQGYKPDAGQLDTHVAHGNIAAAQEKVIAEFHKNLPTEAIAASKDKHASAVATEEARMSIAESSKDDMNIPISKPMGEPDPHDEL